MDDILPDKMNEAAVRVEEPSMGELIKLGQCQGCGKRAKIVKDTCTKCVKKYGPHYGTMVARIKTDPKFKKLCYGSLKSERARQAFVIQFGLVE